MNPEKQIAVWISASPGDCEYKILEAILTHFKFEYVRKTDHTHLWKHPDLVDHPGFRYGRLQIGSHYRGQQGKSSRQNIEDVVEAVRTVIQVADARGQEFEKKENE